VAIYRDVANFNKLTDFEKGWVVGLLEGEGCFPRYSCGKMSVEIKMGDRDVIERYHTILGNPNEIYEHPTKKKTVEGKPYATMFESRFYGDRAKLLMIDVYPHMSDRRKQRIQELILDHG
jgi:hypothetical protein